MKQLLTLTCIITAILVKSQSITEYDLQKALNDGDAIKAKELADKAIEQSGASNKPGIWYYRGQIYLAIHSSPAKEIQDLASNAIDVAYDAFYKTLELDKNKSYNKGTIQALQSIASQLNYEGANEFNQKNYSKALDYFEKSIKINKLPAINKIDTITFYNAAIAAEKLNNLDKAISYYEQCKQMNFGGTHIYIDLIKIYFKASKENKAIETFNQACKVFPKNKFDFYSEIINYYLSQNKNEKAKEYTIQALNENIKHEALYYILGAIYDQEGKQQLAIENYNKSLEINPLYQDALYNLAAIYFNEATDKIKIAKTKSEQNEAIEYYKKAQPLLETYINNFTKEELILKMLKTIYTLTNQQEKLEQVNEWLNDK